MIKKLKKTEKKNKIFIRIRKSNKHLYIEIYSIYKNRIITSVSTNGKFFKKYNKEKKINKKKLKIICKELYFKSINLKLKKIFFSLFKVKYNGKVRYVCKKLNSLFNGNKI
ncbi:50S ribosomal protein L18 [Candidatus Vidania fulgoroideorum]